RACRGKPLDDAECLTGAAIWRAVAGKVSGVLAVEVRRLDDQRVPFPSASRVTHVRSKTVTDMRASIERDDARLVNRLVSDRDESWGLDDLIGIAVDGRHHRAGDTTRDAAIV